MLTLTLYLFVPLANLISGMYVGITPQYDLINNENMPYLMFYYVTCFSRLYDFFMFIRPKPLKDAILYRKYMAEQERLEDMAGMDALESETQDEQAKAVLQLIRQDKFIPYLEQTRKYGEGDLRIGKPLALRYDLFSLAFISQLSNELIVSKLDYGRSDLISAKQAERRKTVLHSGDMV